ncbi:MAG: hypothetical protein JNM20_08665 [Rhizobiales bacterium]|nr:hypothetical protein [Hyphomicrobiales bacterium]
MPRISRDRIKQVVDEVRALDPPADAFWQIVEERLGLDSGDVFHFIAEDPVFYGFAEDEELPPKKT